MLKISFYYVATDTWICLVLRLFHLFLCIYQKRRILAIFKFKLPFIYFICFFYPKDLIVLKLIKEAYFYKTIPGFWYFHLVLVIRVIKIFEVECRCISKNLSKLFYILNWTNYILFIFYTNTNAKVKGRESFRIFPIFLVSLS